MPFAITSSSTFSVTGLPLGIIITQTNAASLMFTLGANVAAICISPETLCAVSN
jgi:hypothetical protein